MDIEIVTVFPNDVNPEVVARLMEAAGFYVQTVTIIERGTRRVRRTWTAEGDED